MNKGATLRLLEAIARHVTPEGVRQRVIDAVARVVSVAHPTNKSGNNMSQR